MGEPWPSGSPKAAAWARADVITALHQLIDTLTRLSEPDEPVHASPTRDLALLLNAEEAAKLLSLSRPKVCDMANRGEIPSIRVGRAIRIPRDPLLAWVDQHTSVASATQQVRLPSWTQVDRTNEL